jgi:hypothetical protein
VAENLVDINIMMLCVGDVARGTLRRENKNYLWSSNIVAGDVHF